MEAPKRLDKREKGVKVSGQLAYRGGVILVALLLCYLSIALTSANALALRAPELALRLWPGHAQALSRRAATSLSDGLDKAALTRARPFALRGLRRDPSMADAARTLALARAIKNDEKGADALFSYAEAMSRRDIPTQYWLIERRVAANDVPGALMHYRIALQVAPQTREQLFPVMAKALSDRSLVAPIAGIAAESDTWRPWFLYYVAQNAAPGDSAALFLELARRNKPPNESQSAMVVTSLVDHDDVALAGQVYRLIQPSWRASDPGSQLEPDFARHEGDPAFGWKIDEALAWVASASSSEPAALHVGFGDLSDQVVATKTLALTPGSYVLSGTLSAGEAGSRQLVVKAACRKGGQELAKASLSPVAGDRRFSLPINVPAQCAAQTLSFITDDLTGAREDALWISRLKLEQGSAR